MSSNNFEILNCVLFEKCVETHFSIIEVMIYVKNKFSFTEESCKKISTKLKAFIPKCKKNWNNAHRRRDIFQKKHSTWLDKNFAVELEYEKKSEDQGRIIQIYVHV